MSPKKNQGFKLEDCEKFGCQKVTIESINGIHSLEVYRENVPCFSRTFSAHEDAVNYFYWEILNDENREPLNWQTYDIPVPFNSGIVSILNEFSERARP